MSTCSGAVLTSRKRRIGETIFFHGVVDFHCAFKDALLERSGAWQVAWFQVFLCVRRVVFVIQVFCWTTNATSVNALSSFVAAQISVEHFRLIEIHRVSGVLEYFNLYATYWDSFAIF